MVSGAHTRVTLAKYVPAYRVGKCTVLVCQLMRSSERINTIPRLLDHPNAERMSVATI